MNKSSESFPSSDREQNDWSELFASDVEPKRLLDDVVSALQILLAETSTSSFANGSLVDLHGALLVYELAGRAEAIPSVGLGVTARRGLERKVVGSARRLTGTARGDAAAFAAWKRSAARIEDLIDLIDPELRLLAVS
jgi:hypothetical protein